MIKIIECVTFCLRKFLSEELSDTLSATFLKDSTSFLFRTVMAFCIVLFIWRFDNTLLFVTSGISVSLQMLMQSCANSFKPVVISCCEVCLALFHCPSIRYVWVKKNVKNPQENIICDGNWLMINLSLAGNILFF